MISCHYCCSVIIFHHIHAFISSRLDYCNGLLTGVYDCVLRNLQSAKFPLLVWVPKRWNLTTSHQCFAMCIVFRSVNELYSKPPCWFTSVWPGAFIFKWVLFTGFNNGILHVLRTKTSIHSRSFTVAGPVTWKSLPAELRTLELSFPSFTKRLETSLFNSYWLQSAGHLLLPRI